MFNKLLSYSEQLQSTFFDNIYFKYLQFKDQRKITNYPEVYGIILNNQYKLLV